MAVKPATTEGEPNPCVSSAKFVRWRWIFGSKIGWGLAFPIGDRSWFSKSISSLINCLKTKIQWINDRLNNKQCYSIQVHESVSSKKTDSILSAPYLGKFIQQRHSIIHCINGSQCRTVRKYYKLVLGSYFSQHATILTGTVNLVKGQVHNPPVYLLDVKGLCSI